MMVWVIFWVEEAIHTVKNTMESWMVGLITCCGLNVMVDKGGVHGVGVCTVWGFAWVWVFT